VSAVQFRPQPPFLSNKISDYCGTPKTRLKSQIQFGLVLALSLLPFRPALLEFSPITVPDLLYESKEFRPTGNRYQLIWSENDLAARSGKVRKSGSKRR
jgi:hypothetical protein